MKNIKMLVASLAMGLAGVSALVLDHTVPGLMGYAMDGNVRAVGVQDAAAARDEKNVQFPTPISVVSEDLPVMTGHPDAAVTKAHPVGFIKDQKRDNVVVATYMVTVTTTGPVTAMGSDSHLTVISDTYLAESEVVVTLTVSADSDTTVPVTATVTTDSLSTESATAADDYSATDSSSSTSTTDSSSSASETASSSTSTQSSDSSTSATPSTSTSSGSSTSYISSASVSITSSFDSSASSASPAPTTSELNIDPSTAPIPQGTPTTPDSTSDASASPTPSDSSAASNCTVLNALSTLALFYAALHFWDMPFFDRI
ncbi:serine/threonine-protein kinase cbk1 [Apiospora arundinis]